MHARQRHHLRHRLYQRRGQHPGTRRPGDRHARDGVIRDDLQGTAECISGRVPDEVEIAASECAGLRVLSEIASHGYLINAIGALALVPGRERAHTPASRLLDAIGWITAQAADQASEYFERVNTNRIAAMGQSCGGAQVVYAAVDPRVTTAILFNAGMGELTMAGADKESLRALHGPIVYIVGGPTDVAYVNAELDYARIDHVPVAFTSLEQGGHMGTFAEEFGGSFARVARDWLDWQLKGRADHAAVFVAGDLTLYPGWTAKARNV